MTKKLSLFLMLACLSLLAFQVDEKSATAERYDVTLQLQSDGSLQVRETIVFDFQGGPFTYTFRNLDTQGTDGIDSIQAWLDGVPMPEGSAPGQVEIVPAGEIIDVTWHYPPTSNSRRTFELAYRARGVLRPEDAGPRLWWWAIPPNHAYPIQAATISLAYPESARLAQASLDAPSAQESHNPIRFDVPGTLGADAGVRLDARFAPGSLVVAAPAWLVAQEQGNSTLHTALIAGGLLTAALLAVYSLLLVRNLQASHKLLAPPYPDQHTPPGDLSPAIAGLLVFNRSEPLATLFDLAGRGLVCIREMPAQAGSKWKFSYDLQPDRGGLLQHEEKLLDLLGSGFGSGEPQPHGGDMLGDFRQRLEDDLVHTGLIEPKPRPGSLAVKPEDRGAVWLLVVISYACAFFLFWIAWELGAHFTSQITIALVAGFWLCLGLPTLFILRTWIRWRSQRYTPNGYQAGIAWRGFAEYLQSLTEVSGAHDAVLFERYLPYAAAFGIFKRWVRASGKAGRLPSPDYFQPASDRASGGFDLVMLAGISDTFRASSVNYSESDDGGWGGGGGGDGGASGGGSSGVG